MSQLDALCRDLDVEWLLDLPLEQRRSIIDAATMILPAKAGIDRALAQFLKAFLEWFHLNPLDQPSPKRGILTIRLDNHLRDSSFLFRQPLLLKDRLNEEKDSIDRFHHYDRHLEAYYGKVTKLYDRFAFFKNNKDVFKPYYRVSNAWLKCWEMIHAFSLIPAVANDYNVFCNAEFPGSFIFAIHHYIQTKTQIKKYEWVASSLWPGARGILEDSYGLYRKYQKEGRWLMDGVNRSGDVMDPTMMTYLLEEFPRRHAIDLYTSDIGIALRSDEFSDQEELETPLNLGQIVHGLCTLREGGAMVCKMFECFTPFNMTLLYIVSGMFRQFYITKPATSRPANSEIYVVGKGFLGYERNATTIHALANDYLFQWRPEMNQSPIALEGKVVEMTRDFYLRIVFASYEIYYRQIRFIRENVKLAQQMSHHYPELGDITVENAKKLPEVWREFQYRESIVQDWIKAYGPIPYLAREKGL